MLLCVACEKSNKHPEVNVDSYEGVSLNQLVSCIENSDSIYKIVEDSIFFYIKSNHNSIPESPKKLYNLIDSIAYDIFAYEELIVNEWQIYESYSLTAKRLQFLNYYLLKQIEKIANKATIRLLYKEQRLADSLEVAQHRFLRIYFDDDTTDYVPHQYEKYDRATLAIYQDMNESLKDLNFLLTEDSYQSPSQYEELSNDLFNTAYAHIKDDLILKEATREGKRTDAYDEPVLQALYEVKFAWRKFISNRNDISKFLSEDQQKVWTNSTNRFKRSHSITLKNEYEGMGLLGPEVAALIVLPDTCSYEELLAYPNFSTKLNEYIKQGRELATY